MTVRDLIMCQSSNVNSPYWINTISSPVGTNAYIDASGECVSDYLGNIYVCGSTSPSAAGTYNTFVSKFDRAGNFVWGKTFGTTNDIYPEACTIDSSGNLYVVGNDVNQLFLVKFNSSGVLQWQINLAKTNYYVYGNSIAVDSSGNVYVTGGAEEPAPSYDANTIVIKFNSSGVLQWQRSFGSASNYEYAQSIDIDSNGNVYVGSYHSPTNGDGVLLKYNSSGVLQWQIGFPAAINEYVYKVKVTPSDDIYVTVTTNTGLQAGILYKFSPTGSVIWSTAIQHPTANIFFHGIALDASGNIYLAGEAAYETLIFKYNSSGTLLWQRSITGISTDKPTITSVINNSFCVAVSVINFVAYRAVLFNLPTDGSLTGDFGIYSYNISTYSVIASPITPVTISSPDAAGTLTQSAGTYVVSNYSPPILFSPIKVPYWIATLGKQTTNVYGTSCAVDKIGGIYVTGGISPGSNDNVFIAKFNQYGVVQWQKELTGSAFEQGSGITVSGDLSNNIYVIGTTTSNIGNNEVFLVKYDSFGVLQWQRTFGSSNLEFSSGSVISDSSDNVYFAGHTSSPSKVFFVKYNSAGVLQYQKTLDFGQTSTGTGIGFSSTTAYISGARGIDFQVSSFDMVAGTFNWTLLFGSSLTTNWANTANTLVGTLPVASNPNSAAICWFDSSGVPLGTRVLVAGANSRFTAITDSVPFASVAIGETESVGATDILLAKYQTATRTLLWQRTFGTTGNAENSGSSLNEDTMGNMYICGTTNYGNGGYSQLLLFKLPATGSLTGTYGPFVYAASSLTDTTRSVSSSNSPPTVANGTYTDQAASFTNNYATAVSNIVSVQS